MTAVVEVSQVLVCVALTIALYCGALYVYELRVRLRKTLAHLMRELEDDRQKKLMAEQHQLKMMSLAEKMGANALKQQNRELSKDDWSDGQSQT